MTEKDKGEAEDVFRRYHALGMARLLKCQRRKYGLSLKAFGAELGYSKAHMSHLESGGREASMRVHYAVANFMQVPMSVYFAHIEAFAMGIYEE